MATYDSIATSKPVRRKGAVRRSDIPPDILEGLNEGRLETVTLAEWLAIDMSTLLRSILPAVGLADAEEALAEAVHRLAGEGVTRRLKGVGEALYTVTRDHPRRDTIFDGLAGHSSDMVRAWAAFMHTADASLTLEARLEAARRFAADRNGSVRECAWASFRSYLANDLSRGLKLLEPWVEDSDPNIRRCAVEGTRPRGVWTAHIETLKRNPQPGLAILEPVRSDSSRYVQRAVANWMNDASKSRPDWTREVCKRWTEGSPTKETAWIVHHALRTLRKKGTRGT
jgi:3-methyladenine DNA glycosylase AlkC